MTPEKERRNYDQTITDILVKIKGVQKDIGFIKDAVPQIWDNKGDIKDLQTKQSLITWIGGACGMGFIYTIIRAYISKPPH